MRFKNCTLKDLETALKHVNKKYWGNIVFNRFDKQGFTLKVKDSKGKGHRRSHQGRRLASACWHVHGDFFDCLFKIRPDAVIHSGKRKTDINSNWQDWDIGSIMEPLYFSEACDCDKDQTGTIE